MENPSPQSSQSRQKSLFSYFKYQEGRHTPNDARNILLIVATLIAAVTFQAGVNPPGGVWQDDKAGANPPDQTGANPPGGDWQDNKEGHRAGIAIYAAQKKPFYVFLISNTMALSTSILVILILTYKFPFHFEIVVATISMLVTYGSAVFAVTPDEAYKFRYVLCAGFIPFGVRGLAHIWTFFRDRCYNKVDAR